MAIFVWRYLMRVLSNLTRDILVETIADGVLDIQDIGPIVFKGILRDGREVRGTYYAGPKFSNPDAETLDEFFVDLAPLMPLVDKLLETQESFVVLGGLGTAIYCIEWSIHVIQ